MTFLTRYTFTLASGEVVHDETVVGEVETLSAVEKDVWIMGQRGTLRVEFDPPLAPDYDSAAATPDLTNPRRP